MQECDDRREGVYFVKSEDDSVLLAFGLVFTGEGFAIWNDGDRGRMIKLGKKRCYKNGKVTVRRDESEGNGKYTFVPLTYQIYKSLVEPRLVNPMSIETEEQFMQIFMKPSDSSHEE